jgi:hypothetical protein
LDKLDEEELAVAEKELIQALNTGDPWPVIGLGHIRSQKALPVLYGLLSETERSMKLIVAHAIFLICGDQQMIGTVLKEIPKLENWYEFIDVLYILPDFRDSRVDNMLQDLCGHPDYLVSYNAKRAMKLATKKSNK